jgi:hypothetical protein
LSLEAREDALGSRGHFCRRSTRKREQQEPSRICAARN